MINFADGINNTHEIDCNNLRMGQYICPHPDYDFIDTKTQQPKGCTKENKAKGIKVYLFSYKLLIVLITPLDKKPCSITIFNYFFQFCV